MRKFSPKNAFLLFTGVLVVVIVPYLVGFVPVFLFLGKVGPQSLLGQWSQGILASLLLCAGIFIGLLVGVVLVGLYTYLFPKKEKE